MISRSLRIATRKSPLALWQTEHVAARLRALHPNLKIELLPLSTRGDEVLDRSLAAIGGKGLFLKELELAMQAGQADCAVHSLKDVPMELDVGFALAAVLPRDDPFDAWVSSVAADIDALPAGAVVGTSSLRRQAQLRARRPDLVLRDLRGNVNTRLKRLDDGDYQAIILACAGLQRLGLGERIRSRLQAPDWLPAPAQGAMAVECLAGDGEIHALLAALDDPQTHRCVAAERAMNRALHGSCHVPVAAYCVQHGATLRLEGLVGDVASGQCLRASGEGAGDDPEALGRVVAAQLLAAGAGALLAQAGNQNPETPAV